MEITSDVTLRGRDWNKAVTSLSTIFKNRTNYSLYILSVTLGIMYDRRIENPDENGEEPKYVPRNVLQNRDNGKLDFLFQAAILSTQTEQLSEEQRLELAFGENVEFNRMGFLTQFANYGVTKLTECVGESPIETMENVKNFLFATVEGRNLEIDSLPDDVLLM